MACNHDCSSCSSKCDKADFLVEQNKFSKIDNVIAVISGKGGVGKSLITGLLASCAKKDNKEVGVLDADITGPTMPRVFGIAHEKANGDEEGIFPVATKNGIKVMSINLLMEDETEPVIWRGPVIAGAIKQFWTDVKWGNVDTMFVDCPPGTGDVPLTVFQSFPIKGIVVVTSPQDLVEDIVEKAVNMAKMMDVPILGIIQNMSYFVCNKCNGKHYIFGNNNIEIVAKRFGINNVCEIPMDPAIASQCDKGNIYDISIEQLNDFYNKVIK